MAIGLLVWLLLKMDISSILNTILSLSFPTLLFVNVINLIAILWGAMKWKYLLRDVSYKALLNIYIIGSYYSMVLPGQVAGEAAKAYILGKDHIETEKVVASVLIDKITAIVGLLIVSVVGLLFSHQRLSPIIVYSFANAVFFFLAILFLCKFSIVNSFIFHTIEIYEKKYYKYNKSITFIKNLFGSWLEFICNTKVMLVSIIIGCVFQYFCIEIISSFANNLGIVIPFFDWCWIFGFLSIVLLLPISIAGLGIREGTLVGLLALYGISHEKAMALSFALLSLQLIWALIGGLLEIKRLKYKKENNI
jgi:uncharacterized protein (TIRG00374 family)